MGWVEDTDTRRRMVALARWEGMEDTAAACMAVWAGWEDTEVTEVTEEEGMVGWEEIPMTPTA